MTVRVLFFAHLQDMAGSREQSVTLPPGATVRALADELQRHYPQMGDLLARARVAVQAEMADAETVLKDGDEVAWMPPMSGGAA